MVKPRAMVLDMHAMTGGRYLAIENTPNYSYVNGVRSTQQDGFKTICVMPSLAFEKITVKSPNGLPVGNEIPEGGIPVSFENLVVNPYLNNGNLGLSARADKILLASSSVSGTKNEAAK